MTTFTTNTDLNARGRRLAETCKEAHARVWHFVAGLPAGLTRRAADPVEALARTERREAARRAADNLLLR